MIACWPTPTRSWCSASTICCSEQEAAPEEIAAITEWLKREGTCLLLAPHHDVGFTDDYDQRQIEYEHHGDRLVPRQQRFSQYTRSLMKALDVPVDNIWGLRPAVVEGTKEIAPLTGFPTSTPHGLLDNVTTFNFHPHLPHYELTRHKATDCGSSDASASTRTGRIHSQKRATRSSTRLIWMPPGRRASGRHRAHRIHALHHAVRRHRHA